MRFRIGIGALLIVLPFVAWLQSGTFTCSWRAEFGVPCPGCGIQRGIASLCNGNVVSAFINYPPLGSLAIVYALLATAVLYSGQRERIVEHALPAASFAASVVLVGNWILQLTR